jgi:hypothetical protein
MAQVLRDLKLRGKRAIVRIELYYLEVGREGKVGERIFPFFFAPLSADMVT